MALFRKKKKRGGMTREQALRCVPIRSNEIETYTSDSGDLIITYPVVLKPWMAKIAGRRSQSDGSNFRKLQLDELGSEVWGMIDNEKTVQQLIDDFALKHQLHVKEAEVSITTFLRELGKRGLVGLK